MTTTYLFPELETRRVKNGDRIRLSSLRWVQRALQRMHEDSGYWVGDGMSDKTTGENVFSRLSWHIVAASGSTITVTPTDVNEDCRNRCMFAYSRAGDGGNSRIHGARFGCVAPGDRLQISFPSVWEIGHNAVVRKVEFVGQNSLKLTLDRATGGIKNSTHPRYKIGSWFEIHHATITDVPYLDDAGTTRWTIDTQWAVDGALIATTSRRIMPATWFQISPRTQKHGCQFCMCDHSNSAALLAPTGTAIDADGRHWYCAKRKYFTETFVPYPEGSSQGGGEYVYEWHTPSGLANFRADCLVCSAPDGQNCDCYVDSYDDGTGAPKNWAYVDEGMHLCRILDDWWQSVPRYTETVLQPPGAAIFRYQRTGAPSILAQKRIPAALVTHPDPYTTRACDVGKWSVATLSSGLIAFVGGGTFTPCDNMQSPGWGFAPRIKPFERSGRGAADFSKSTPVLLHPKKPKKTIFGRVIGAVVFGLWDGTGRLFFTQKRMCVTIGSQRWTFDSSGGDGFYLPNSLQPREGDTASFGSVWAGVRKYDNAIIAETQTHGEVLFQVSGAACGDGADSPQQWHLVHETYDAGNDVWVTDPDQDDVDVPPPAAIFSGATDTDILLRMCRRDSIVLDISDINYAVIQPGDTISFERAGTVQNG